MNKALQKVEEEVAMGRNDTGWHRDGNVLFWNLLVSYDTPIQGLVYKTGV